MLDFDICLLHNEQVLRYCYFLWVRLGHNKFNKLREILVLPARRTLQNYRHKHVPDGSGFSKKLCLKARTLIIAKANCDDDLIVIGMWDATGYAKRIWFNKNSGRIEGLDCQADSFNTKRECTNKVNCFLIQSPWKHITAWYPVAYFHCTTLDAEDIRRQWYSVVNGLKDVGLTVGAYVCDGASEHSRMFEMILTKCAQADPTLKISDGKGIATSDVPHLSKKLRNNLISSGESEFHSKRLTKNGNLICWRVERATYYLTNVNEHGSNRVLRLIPGFNLDVMQPSSIQRLRVGLAVKAFCKAVRHFIAKNLDKVAAKANLRVQDVNETLKYMTIADELFQIMNTEKPVTWTSEMDSAGVAIGLRDKVNTCRGDTLNLISKIYGVDVGYLKAITGLKKGSISLN